MEPRGGHRDDIEGLRALAVAAVILFHVDRDWLPGGFIGVDVFLVISGYLITLGVVGRAQRGAFSLPAFYLARIRRIVPAYMAMLALTTLAMGALLAPRDYATFRESLTAALYFDSARHFATHYDYFGPAAHEFPLLHTWSLAIEMQVYLLLPVVLVLVPRRALPYLLAATTVLLVAATQFRLAEGERQAVYFSLAARIPEFLIGALLAVVVPCRTLSRPLRQALAGLGLAAILASFALVSDAAPFPGLLALPACLGAAMLIAARDSVLNRALSNGVLVRIGALSYALYLWHWPILAGLRYYFETYHLSGPVIVAAVVVTFGLSWASYRLVEVPLRRRSFTVAAIPGYAALALAVIVAVGLAGPLNSRLAAPLPDRLTRYAEQSEICHGKVLDSCARGAMEAERTLLLLGDSHAAQLNHFADEVGAALGLRFEVITASSCVPIAGFDVARVREAAQQACRDQIAEVARRLEAVDGIVLAGKWVFHTPSGAFMAALDDFLDTTRQGNTPLLVLAQVPMLAGDIQRSLRFDALGLPRASARDDAWRRANERVAARVEAHGTARFLDLSGLGLFRRAPFHGDELLYFDSHHLNEVGARAYGRAAVPHVDAWLREAF